jgi:hypothetical protein
MNELSAPAAQVADKARRLAAECRQSARYHERKTREEEPGPARDVARELAEDYRLKARALDVYAALCAAGYSWRLPL